MTTPDTTAPRTEFWGRVQKSEGCWEWMAGRHEDGYGHLNVAGRRMRAHRYSWELHNGPIPVGMLVCHSCDNPPCVRPDHLFLGTIGDNNRDRAQKGRTRWSAEHLRRIGGTSQRGERNGSAKLTSEMVLAIRASNETHSALGRRYGVGRTAIAKIRNGERWAHVGIPLARDTEDGEHDE